MRFPALFTNKRSRPSRIGLLIFVISGLLAGTSSLSAQNIEHPVRMPAVFDHGLIFLEPVTKDGDTLRFYTDTADATLMYDETVQRLGLVTTSAIIQNQEQQAAFLPTFEDDFFIPVPLISDGLIPIRADDRKPPHHQVILEQGDGILGSTWFAARSWSINYRTEEMYVRPTGASFDQAGQDMEPHSDIAPESRIPLSFYEEDGETRYYFARLPVVVEDDTLSMVLKTGSSVILDEESRDILGHPSPHFPAGLISESIFDRWQEQHSDWTVYENADMNYRGDMIEVPEVHVGPHTAGPVHFAVRQDDAFIDWFSQFTDEEVVGALGPDAFLDAHITLDYPNAVLIFQD